MEPGRGEPGRDPAAALRPNEVTGRLAVRRDGGALVLDERGRPVLAVDPDRLDLSGAMHGDLVVARRLKHRTAIDRRQAAAAERCVPAPAGATPGPAGASRPGPGPSRPSPAGAEVPRGQIVRVLERANPTLVGTYQRQGREEWVEPDDRRLPRVLVRGTSLGAEPGEKVVVALASFPSVGRPEPAGPVVERLGAGGDPDVETLAIIRSHNLRDDFPAEVLAEAERLPRQVGPADEAGRLDLRAATVFTIDDADARDLDDAISVELLRPQAGEHSRGSGAGVQNPVWRLGVHIADVAHYVPPGSALDEEARRRGTSVYLADRVLPMFPPRLSNGIASLHPGADRLTVSVFMNVDGNGRVVAYDVGRSVVRSAARLTYDAVASLLGPGAGPRPEDAPGSGWAPEDGADAVPPEVAAALRAMEPLAAALRRRRLERGSLDFDLVEEKARLDGQGRPVAVVRRTRSVATQLIEEFMIAANEAVADFLLWSGVPYVRRIHEDPFPDDLEALREQLAPLGYRVPATRAPRPADLQAILEAAKGRPEGEDVHAALLRALPQARYSALPGGHFALASANYLHFTSPIRRYPDLTVHRQVLAVLDGRPTREDAPALEALAAFCSRAERAAESAEAESLELVKARLGLGLLGDVLDGEVVEVFGFGAFVRLPNGAEGLVQAADGGRGLRRGQRIRVQVVRADVARRQVRLHPA